MLSFEKHQHGVRLLLSQIFIKFSVTCVNEHGLDMLALVCFPFWA